MRLNTIVVVDENWGMGKDGELLVHLRGDLKYFKQKTLNNIIIMGRATLESLPGGKPLSDRINIVMTKNAKLKGNFYTANSIESLSSLLNELTVENRRPIPFVVGGESIYQQLLPYTETCFVTKIRKTFDADKYFVNLDEHPDFELYEEGSDLEENHVKYRFCKYIGKNIKEL